MSDLPAVYTPGTAVVIHGYGNLDGVRAEVVSAKALQMISDGSVGQFMYTVQLANLAMVQVDDKHLAAVEQEEQP